MSYSVGDNNETEIVAEGTDWLVAGTYKNIWKHCLWMILHMSLITRL